MVKWRYCLVLAVLLLLPFRTGSMKEQDDDEVRRNDDEEDNGDDDNDDDFEEEESSTARSAHGMGRTAAALQLRTSLTLITSRTTKKRPLECYVCSYKSETPLRGCLDPTKFRVHTITCHSSDDKCFTSVISKDNSYDAVVRGCRTACVGTPEVTCCELDRCNQQAFAMPTLIAPRSLTATHNATTKPLHPSVLFFVTILLLLQTVVKVAFV